jgi:hypothetical protein
MSEGVLIVHICYYRKKIVHEAETIILEWFNGLSYIYKP